MVIIIDMENGERNFVQDVTQDNAPLQPGKLELVCPELQPYPTSVDERRIMPGLMEHPFSKAR